jgi:hypothetical protein
MPTEKEAMTDFICPSTRNSNDPDGYPCLGSKCMRWCWKPVQEHRKGNDRIGYCGSGGQA